MPIKMWHEIFIGKERHISYFCLTESFERALDVSDALFFVAWQDDHNHEILTCKRHSRHSYLEFWLVLPGLIVLKNKKTCTALSKTSRYYNMLRMLRFCAATGNDGKCSFVVPLRECMNETYLREPYGYSSWTEHQLCPLIFKFNIPKYLICN